MSNTLVFANFDQTSEEKCMFFSFSGNYFFLLYGRIGCISSTIRKKKKGKKRKADNLRADDLPGKITISCVVPTLGDIIKSFYSLGHMMNAS